MHLPLDPKLNADAYMQWAHYTRRQFFNSSSDAIVLLARFRKRIDHDLRRNLSRSGVWISGRYDGYRYATVTVSAADLPDQLELLHNMGAECFELATPFGIAVKPEDALGIRRDADGPDTVLGIIDDGCPFAHVHYRDTDSHALAVRFIWDQAGTVKSGKFGPVATPFAYGAAFMSDNLQEIMLEAAKGGLLDEESAYRISALPSLRGATSHGAQVMSHATGYALLRPQPLSMLGSSDIAFVQLPPDALDDPSGAWLDHYALDGIHAIRSYARHVFNTSAQRVIINLSYGPETGPHDGSSHLEKAIDELTREARDDGYYLHVVVPSGNSNRLRAHAEFDLDNGGGTIDWCVSPDSQRPSFIEIWLPEDTSMDDLQVSLTAPNGELIPARYLELHVSANETAATVALPVCGCERKKMVLMIVAPTARTQEPALDDFPLAAAGRWKVEVKTLPSHSASGIAHAYLARSDPNFGRPRRGRSGYLDSPGYDPNLRECDQLKEETLASGAEVMARGSINGIATGVETAVASGYSDSTKRPSFYSSGGPSRGTRKGPDWAYPTDESGVLPGVLAGGNHSGAVFRLIGTSFAAPQYARELMVTPAPPGPPGPPPLPPAPTPPPPPPPPPWFEQRVGDGMR